MPFFLTPNFVRIKFICGLFLLALGACSKGKIVVKEDTQELTKNTINKTVYRKTIKDERFKYGTFRRSNVFTDQDTYFEGRDMKQQKSSYLKMEDFRNCSTFKQQPWKKNQNEELSRFLFADFFTSTETEGETIWKVVQIKDTNETSVFSFISEPGSGRKLLMFFKDNQMIQQELQDEVVLKNTKNDLTDKIGEEAFVLFGREGSKLAFIPGLAGEGRLRIDPPEDGNKIVSTYDVLANDCLIFNAATNTAAPK